MIRYRQLKKGNDMKSKAKKIVMNYAPNTTLTIQKLFVASITNAF